MGLIPFIFDPPRLEYPFLRKILYPPFLNKNFLLGLSIYALKAHGHSQSNPYSRVRDLLATFTLNFFSHRCKQGLLLLR